MSYTWTLNGTIIEPYNYQTGFGVHSDGELEIEQFGEQHVGNYSCIVKSLSGEREHTFQYRLVDICTDKILRGPECQRIKAGENVFLPCEVQSQLTKVKWKKNRLEIDSTINSRYQKMENNNLLIVKAQKDETGVYECVVEDVNGCYSYVEAQLTVADQPRCNSSFTNGRDWTVSNNYEVGSSCYFEIQHLSL